MANTYSALTSSILSYTNNTTSDELSAERDGIIRRSQLKLSRDLADMLALDVVATATVGSGDHMVNLPTSAVLVRSVRMIDTSGTAIQLQKREFEYCKEYWPNVSDVTASPRYYADCDEANILIAGTPSGSAASGKTWELKYTERLAYLSAGNATNWFTDHAEDALLACCLVEAYAYLQDEERATFWYQKYTGELANIRGETVEERKDRFQREYTKQVP